MVMNLKKSYSLNPVVEMESSFLDDVSRLDSSLPPLVPTSLPSWRKAFYLGENVRFTRTPDIEFIRQRAETDEQAAVKLRRIVEKQHRKHAPIHNAPTHNTHTAPTGDAMSQAIAAPQASLVQEDDSSHQEETIASNPASLISDFAYFDCGIDLSQNAQGSRVNASQADPQQEEALCEGGDKSITDLFHVLECRFAKDGQVTGEEAQNRQVKGDESGYPMLDMALLQNSGDGSASFAQHYHIVPTVRFDMPLDIQPVLQQQEWHETPSLQIEEAEQETSEVLEPTAEILAVEESTEPVETVQELEPSDCGLSEAETALKSIAAEEATPSQKNLAITLRPARPLPSNDLSKGLRPADLVDDYAFPALDLLQQPIYQDGAIISQETLERSAGLLENVLEDFGIRGEIIHVRPGPVVTLYEFEPAPGVKSSRIIGLADDIARSMSAISARVAVIPGRNVIGIELPNPLRETVFLRELIQAEAYLASDFKLPLALGKNIGGEPIVAELAKMPHLLVAGTTGSGKSVAINTMILSLLYRLTPDQCRLIMVDPKMLELSIYDGIPHLLTPVVTDPKKAVTALKWAVREMEERYRKMAKLGVRNIDGFNARIAEASQAGETITCTVQAGFDKETGELLYEEEAMDLTPLPYIVVIVDEMADLMMVAGKEIEGAIQRLAQMARAAGIHLIMATQRPSVDVITGTIKANFPTRISFQVTSKIDSRTILGEPGAETLLGQGDMLHMAGGGRIVRVHGAFVSDGEVESIVSHLKAQGKPDYLATVTTDNEETEEEEVSNIAEIVANIGEDSEELYVQAVKVVMRDKKCSTSYIQRRLGVGYNKAASLVERMEKEGLVGAANHVGKREILSPNRTKSDGES